MPSHIDKRNTKRLIANNKKKSSISKGDKLGHYMKWVPSGGFNRKRSVENVPKLLVQMWVLMSVSPKLHRLSEVCHIEVLLLPTPCRAILVCYMGTTVPGNWFGPVSAAVIINNWKLRDISLGYVLFVVRRSIAILGKLYLFWLIVFHKKMSKIIRLTRYNRRQRVWQISFYNHRFVYEFVRHFKYFFSHALLSLIECHFAS